MRGVDGGRSLQDPPGERLRHQLSRPAPAAAAATPAAAPTAPAPRGWSGMGGPDDSASDESWGLTPRQHMHAVCVWLFRVLDPF